MKILAIETSCDETAMAIVEASGSNPPAGGNPRFKVLANAVSSQIAIHCPFGGVVPNLAKREHLKNLPIVLGKIKKQLLSTNNNLNTNKRIRKLEKDSLLVDLIGVTVGPGLEPALWTGINFAKDLANRLKIKLVGVNHLEGHIYSNWLPKITSSQDVNIKFPAICLIVSGGHTTLLLMTAINKWEKLGETRDDAVGEAFDKVAKMLKLPYPGGPEVERLAKNYGGSTSIDFPRPMIYDKNYDFSFSGLKTSVLYYLRDHKKINKAAVCAGFQKAAIDVLIYKTIRAVKESKAKSVLLCGGVACNKALQKEFKKSLKTINYKLKTKFFVPDKKLNTDNAVMIAAAAYLSKKKYKIRAQGNLDI